MKKNKNSRVFSRVLHHLSRANVCRFYGTNGNAYKEALAAKRCLEECGCEGVKVLFYDREYHLGFEVSRARDCHKRHYTVDASHGYVNDYHAANNDHIKALIELAEHTLDCKLRNDFNAYQWLQTVADSVLFAGLPAHEYDGYCQNGKISDIPFDTAVNLWWELRECMERIVDEAVAHKGVQI